MTMMIEHLKTLMDIGPHTTDQARVHEALEYCQGVLRGAEWHADIITDDGTNSLYAHPRGERESKVLLHAHVDVVSAANYGCNVDDDVISGRGCYDMLFAVASYLQFAQDNTQALDELNVSIMLTGDEEIGGQHGTRFLLGQGYRSEVCVMPDAGDSFGELSVAAKGSHQLLVHVSGESHHASRPWEGDGAAGKLVELLHKLQLLFTSNDRDDCTLTVSTLQAGESYNQGPAAAEAVIDIRYPDQQSLEPIKQRLGELLHEYDATARTTMNATDYTIDVDNQYMSDFVGLYECHVGGSVELTKAHGSSDAHYFINQNVPVIMLRPDGGDAHGDDEWLDMASWRQFHQLIEEYVLTTATISN